MVYIITSKTRKRKPNGRMMQVEKSDGNTHIATERELEKRMQRTQRLHLPDPKPIPGVDE